MVPCDILYIDLNGTVSNRQYIWHNYCKISNVEKLQHHSVALAISGFPYDPQYPPAQLHRKLGRSLSRAEGKGAPHVVTHELHVNIACAYISIYIYSNIQYIHILLLQVIYYY